MYNKFNMPYRKVTRELMQGETLSPLLFALVLADFKIYMRKYVIRGVQTNYLKDLLLLGYADDLAFFSGSLVLIIYLKLRL